MFGMSKKIIASSVVSDAMKIKGSVESESELYVDGLLEGPVKSKILVVGVNGRIKTPGITAEKVVVHGLVEGDIDAVSVYLGATARINGNIHHKDISIENGAFINGDLKQKRG
jgi:cytoskeletal protein CcmA (bactofilin family)